MSEENTYNNELVAKMLHDAFTFDGRFQSEEFTRFRNGFASTVDECAKELGYENRDAMIHALRTKKDDELLKQIELINVQLKQKSQNQMAKLLDIYYNSGNKDQSMRSLLQVMLGKLRKSIASAENEVSRLIAEILYGIVTLATLRI